MIFIIDKLDSLQSFIDISSFFNFLIYQILQRYEQARKIPYSLILNHQLHVFTIIKFEINKVSFNFWIVLVTEAIVLSEDVIIVIYFYFLAGWYFTLLLALLLFAL